MKVFCGIDWAENHHDVALVDERGQLVVKSHIGDDAAGLATLLTLLAEHGDNPTDPIPVAIETSRGLLVASVRATGRPMYAINPLAVSRYRERHTVARAKSDHADAVVLANILRTDADVHQLHTAFAGEQMRQLPRVEAAFGEQARALVLQLDAACRAAEHLAAATEEIFTEHPDAAILTSFPGVGTQTGARILAEIGDDRSRFAEARNLRAYAGSAPVTRASGKSIVVMQRRIKNQRLAAAGYVWAGTV